VGLSFVLPAALALSAFVALPILAHLAKQTPRERHPFGAMLLLERVVKRLRRRRRVKDPLVLLARILAVLAIVLGVSGAQWSYSGAVPEFGASGRVIVIIDNSMSMSLEDGGSTLLARARGEAVDFIEELPPGTLVGAVAFNSDARRLVQDLTPEHLLVTGKIEDVQPSGGASNLRSALSEARKLLASEPGEIVLFSDEAGPRIVGEARSELELVVEDGSSVIPFTIRADPPRNTAVTSAVYGDGLEGGRVAIRLTNFGPDPIEIPCEATLPDGAVVPIFADLPPEGEAEEHITVPREALGGVGQVACEDPDLQGDDARYFHLPRVGASRVLVVDGDPGDTPTRSEVYFLERALAPWGGKRTGVTPDVVPPSGLLGLDSDKHRVVFLANVSDPRPYGPRLTEFVRKGGALIISAGDNISARRYNSALGAILPAPFRKSRSLAASGEVGIPLNLPDPTHPLFGTFKRAGRAGFGKVRSRKVLTLEPFTESDDISILLRYSNGMPALIERRLGSGRVLLWTSSFDFDWGNLPVQSVFMPLVQGMVAYLGGEAGGAAARFDATVGDRVAIPLPDLVMEPDVLGPDGNPITSRIEASSLLFTASKPGAYQIVLENAPPLAWVAVNTPPDESDVRSYDSVAKAEAAIDPEMFTRTIDLGGGLLGLGLALLALSALLSAKGSS